MTIADPRLARLAKMLALHDDAAATDGERAACRHLGEKIAADLGIEFSREAIEKAGGFEHEKRRASSYDFDVDDWLREWMAMTPEQRRASIRDTEETLRRWEERDKKREEERRAAEEERARQKAERDEAMRRQREEEKARKEAENRAEEAERERYRRVKAGIEAPQWNDIEDDHLEWLDRIESLDLSDEDRNFIECVRAGVRDQRLGIYGAPLAKMNDLLKRAAAMEART
ncbi:MULTISPECIES: hypothetical protein [Methylosinus]|uniref:Uncharacterized protein n=1 Tax=Methylosinus trichosporium (strain ATCC 35070 / NCIMB 11131 / UNIQEM 75 / OB3b) TaxID=595536 RepID=A0A2D2CVR7_METT3|nr:MULTISPECIES: hypothetical protein [Methylosinus]ATQ66891.1 hypothetical protein CQW49_02505 [Methylosinus trichosporium OB3b]OBS54145.1 hypothetical protein A8B73_02635 [Methylosinus sp. 3S-1]